MEEENNDNHLKAENEKALAAIVFTIAFFATLHFTMPWRELNYEVDGVLHSNFIKGASLLTALALTPIIIFFYMKILKTNLLSIVFLFKILLISIGLMTYFNLGKASIYLADKNVAPEYIQAYLDKPNRNYNSKTHIDTCYMTTCLVIKDNKNKLRITNYYYSFVKPIQNSKQKIYSNLNAGDNVILTVRTGLWGIRWVEKVKVISSHNEDFEIKSSNYKAYKKITSL